MLQLRNCAQNLKFWKRAKKYFFCFQWKTLTSGLTTFLGRRREWTEAEVEAELSTPPPKKRPETEAEVEAGSADLKIHPWDSTVNLSVHQPLYPPGRVIHIVRHYPRTADGKIKRESVKKRWKVIFGLSQFVLLSESLI